MKIHPVGAELFHADRTDRQTDMTKIIAAFRKFANVPNKTPPCPPHSGMQTAVELQTYAPLTLALYGGNRRISPIGCFTRGKETRYPPNKKLGGPQSRFSLHKSRLFFKSRTSNTDAAYRFHSTTDALILI